MSAIGNRINPDPAVGIELNATQWATAMVAYLLGDASALQVRNFVNDLLAESGYAALSAQEETDMQNIKVYYDSLSNFDKHAFRDIIFHYTQSFQDRNGAEPTTEAWWSGKMGL